MNSAETANRDVAARSRQLAAEGLLIGTAGNVSKRTGDQIAVTATGVTLAAAGSEHVTVVDLDGYEQTPTARTEHETGARPNRRQRLPPI